MMTDPIADMLTRIRNAQLARHAFVEMPSTKMRQAIAGILKEEGYVKDFFQMDNTPSNVLHIDLKYRGPALGTIEKVQRVSRPGNRVYRKANDLPRPRGGLGIAIVSTSRGVMTDKSARELGVGGEVLCKIW
jgi:small subunit ribosomal protein S8